MRSIGILILLLSAIGLASSPAYSSPAFEGEFNLNQDQLIQTFTLTFESGVSLLDTHRAITNTTVIAEISDAAYQVTEQAQSTSEEILLKVFVRKLIFNKEFHSRCKSIPAYPNQIESNGKWTRECQLSFAKNEGDAHSFVKQTPGAPSKNCEKSFCSGYSKMSCSKTSGQSAVTCTIIRHSQPDDFRLMGYVRSAQKISIMNFATSIHDLGASWFYANLKTQNTAQSMSRLKSSRLYPLISYFDDDEGKILKNTEDRLRKGATLNIKINQDSTPQTIRYTIRE